MNEKDQELLVNCLFKKTKEILLQDAMNTQSSKDKHEAENLLNKLNKL